MAMKLPAVDKVMEEQLLSFATSLDKTMKAEEVLALYDKLEREHWLAEGKLITMRLLYQATLNDQFAKEAETQAEAQLPMFR